MICHTLASKGAKVGPQLDGVGIRGLDRLLEDVLDPNRNVDQNFRMTILNLKDGKVVRGLLLREEGEVLVMADDKGKEVPVPKKDVDERSTSHAVADAGHVRGADPGGGFLQPDGVSAQADGEAGDAAENGESGRQMTVEHGGPIAPRLASDSRSESPTLHGGPLAPRLASDSRSESPTLAADLACRPGAWECTPELDARRFAVVRRRLVLHHCKWDPQVGDVSTLARFALILPPDEWTRLARLAERLAAETESAERELLGRPDLMRRLGLPVAVLRALVDADRPPTPAAARVIRFDFHPTPDGWRISEANSDVPGGYTEASSFAALMAEQFPGCTPAGDPAARLADALAAAAGAAIALVAAPGYMEDQQVIAYVAALLQRRGCIAIIADPRQIRWANGVARIGGVGAVDAVFRFYQAEWLAGLPSWLGWSCFFRGGVTPVCNPGTALLTESKRFPLTWDRLSARLDAWRALLPPTRAPGQRGDGTGCSRRR